MGILTSNFTKNNGDDQGMAFFDYACSWLHHVAVILYFLAKNHINDNISSMNGDIDDFGSRQSDHGAAILDFL